MHEINFIDRSFEQSAAGKYILVMQANQGGLTYGIIDDERNQVILFRKHRFNHVILIGDLIEEISAILNSDETLSLSFSQVKFMGFTQQTTLVPDNFYDAKFLDRYLNFNHAGEIDAEIFSNFIVQPGLYNIFALPAEIVTIIRHHFGNVEFMNQTTPFVRHIASQPLPFMRPEVFISMNHGFFDIACTGDGSLKLYNTFQYTGENDLLYYVIYVFDKTGFDMQKVQLNISGERSSKNSYFEVLKQYLPETRFDEAVSIPALSPGVKPLGTTRFLNLLNLSMCVSSGEHTEAAK